MLYSILSATGVVPEHLNTGIRAIVQRLSELSCSDPLPKFKALGTINYIVEPGSWRQRFQDFNAFHTFRTELRKIHLEGKVWTRVVHAFQDVQLITFHVDLYKQRRSM